MSWHFRDKDITAEMEGEYASTGISDIVILSFVWGTLESISMLGNFQLNQVHTKVIDGNWSP